MEFPEDDVAPIGYNLTIVCTGKKSKEGDANLFSEQPFWVQLFFRGKKAKDCGGDYSNRENTKSCELGIENVSRSNSGQYGCIVTNFMTCSSAELTLKLGGEYFYFTIRLFALNSMRALTEILICFK